MNKLLIDLPETIHTQHLQLQMPRAGWGEKVHAAISDGYEDYVKWLNWSATLPSVETVEEDCRKHHAEFILRDCIRYMILDKQTHEVIGRCAFPPFQAHWTIPQFGISYFIRKSRRGKGYATEASYALAKIAFKILKAKKLEIYCDAENIASTKVPLKLGFELEYTQKGGWPRFDNKLAQLQTYSLFDQDSLPTWEINW